MSEKDKEVGHSTDGHWRDVFILQKQRLNLALKDHSCITSDKDLPNDRFC
jgi:hypothetical protein